MVLATFAIAAYIDMACCNDVLGNVIESLPSSSWRRNTRDLSPIYAIGNMERVGGKHEDVRRGTIQVITTLKSLNMTTNLYKVSGNQSDDGGSLTSCEICHCE